MLWRFGEQVTAEQDEGRIQKTHEKTHHVTIGCMCRHVKRGPTAHGCMCGSPVDVRGRLGDGLIGA